jgi:hypothetical protein
MGHTKPQALARLAGALDAFLKSPSPWQASSPQGVKIDPKDGTDTHEIWLVPAYFFDASALLAVDHDTSIVRFVNVYEQLLPEEEDPAQWTEIVKLGATTRTAAKLQRAGKMNGEEETPLAREARKSSSSESAVISSANVVAISAAAAGAVNVIRNIIGSIRDSYDIKKHLREGAERNVRNSERDKD